MRRRPHPSHRSICIQRAPSSPPPPSPLSRSPLPRPALCRPRRRPVRAAVRRPQVRAFYIMFCLGIPTQFMIVTVFAESFIATSIRQEVKDGMYHPVAAAVASWIVQLPAMFLLSACAVLPVFVMGDLHWPAFGWALLIHACMFWTFEGIAQAQALEPSPLLGLMNYLNIYFMAFLFCGMFVPPSDVIWPFRLFTYILPMQWTMKAFMHAVFASTPAYSGALPCTAGTAIAVTLPGNLTRMANCISHANRPGYYCPNDPDGYLCFGYSGADILDSLGVKFSIFGSNTSCTRAPPPPLPWQCPVKLRPAPCTRQALTGRAHGRPCPPMPWHAPRCAHAAWVRARADRCRVLRICRHFRRRLPPHVPSSPPRPVLGRSRAEGARSGTDLDRHRSGPDGWRGARSQAA